MYASPVSIPKADLPPSPPLPFFGFGLFEKSTSDKWDDDEIIRRVKSAQAHPFNSNMIIQISD